MKILLHIGTEKTGTTSIQTFLGQHGQALQAQGVHFYPWQWKTYRLGLDEWKGEWASYLQGLQTVAVQHPEARLIISSELFQSRLDSLPKIRRLHDALTSLDGVDGIDYLLYIRRPAETANSMASTPVQYGASAPLTHRSERLDTICHHAQTIQRWSGVFGADKATIRLFSRDCFEGGSLIMDFQSAAGIMKPIADDHAQVVNSQISADGIYLMQHVNRLIDARTAELTRQGCDPRTLRLRCFSVIEEFLNSPKFVMPTEVWLHYDEAFKASDQWVADHFFPGRDTLWSSSIPAECWQQTIPDGPMAQLAAMVYATTLQLLATPDASHAPRDVRSTGRGARRAIVAGFNGLKGRMARAVAGLRPRGLEARSRSTAP